MELNFIINTQREELTTLRAKIADLERERDQLLITFGHYHVAGHDDIDKCG
jgi:hypothetical protein